MHSKGFEPLQLIKLPDLKPGSLDQLGQECGFE